mmetsp:Transcript_3620/g.5925  ORF Transcript_3620/g.5925 Transcript_3620/m.5925 type:complete len:114 (+) Transcript_3620:90-431(+)
MEFTDKRVRHRDWGRAQQTKYKPVRSHHQKSKGVFEKDIRNERTDLAIAKADLAFGNTDHVPVVDENVVIFKKEDKIVKPSIVFNSLPNDVDNDTKERLIPNDDNDKSVVVNH